MKNLFIVLSILSMFSLTAFSQVTIGSSHRPEDFSILQLEGNGGLRFPQLSTVQRNALPVSGSTDANGLVIYNTDKGTLELWTGNVWVTVPYSGSSLDSNIVGINGIGVSKDENSSETKISLGGQFDSTRILDLNGSNLELVTNKGQLKVNGNYADSLPALDVAGKVRITKPEALPNGGSTLVIDDDGNIGVETVQNKVSMVFFAQSKGKQEYDVISKDNKFNGDTEVGKIVRWNTADVVYNGAKIAQFADENIAVDPEESKLSDKDANKTDFVIQQQGEYEVAGFISYRPNSVLDSSDQDSAVINVTIEVSEDDGKTWREVNLSRTIWAGGFNRVQTILIPPAVVTLKKGSRLHLAFYNPFTSDKALAQGQSANWGISAPSGGTYSKGIRITAL